MMTSAQAIITIAAIALATVLTRALAFVFFPANRVTPRYIAYLGRVLPFAITTMLIVYCLKDVSVFAWPFALPEIISLLVVAGLFLLLKNSLLAIAAGTILYMILVQVVF